MADLKMYTPEGTGDILLERAKTKINIENALRETYVKSGFMDTISPTVEYYDVFTGGNHSIEQEVMYKLFDNHGRILALRPDATIPMARIAATRLKDFGHPLRLCYSLNVFRMNQIWDGKLREVTQSGIEIIGSSSSKADAELLVTAIDALINAGVSDFKIEIGQVDFLNGLLEESGLSSEDKKSLIVLVENKNIPALKEFLNNMEKVEPDRLEALKEIPNLFGKVEVIGRARKLTKNEKALRALNNMEEICSVLEKLGLSSYVSIDLGMVQDIHYYTGIIFKGYVKEVGEAILSGGRYDNLMEHFGLMASATGLAINVDSILSYLEKKDKLEKYLSKGILVYYEESSISEAYSMAKRIRKAGYTAELSLSFDEETLLDYGKKRGYNIAVNILENDRVEVWNLNKGEFKHMEIDDLLSELEE